MDAMGQEVHAGRVFGSQRHVYAVSKKAMKFLAISRHSDILMAHKKKNITSAMPIPVAAFLKLLLCLTSAPSVLAKHRSHNCWPQPAAFATLNNSDKLSEKNDSFKNVSLVLVSLLSIWRDSYFTTVKTGSVSNGKHLCQKYRVLKFMHE